MKYIVRKAVLAPTPIIEIMAEEYSLLAKARTTLVSALAMEEKYEILIANYLALETSLLQIAASNTVRNTASYSALFEVRSALNVQLVNLLTAARLYLDQICQEVADCLRGDASAADSVKAECSRQYEKHFEYRFMEALRNHVQHRGIPIHYLGHLSQWTSFDEDGRMEFAVDIAALRQYLEEDKKFKKSVLAEMSERVDLVAACRRYIESLSEIHEFSRNLVSAATSNARSRIEAVHRRYAEVWSESLVGLAASSIEDERETSSIPLLLDWDDVLLELLQRNTRLVNLRKRYVTGRTMEDRKARS